MQTTKVSTGLQLLCDILGALAAGLWIGTIAGLLRNSGEPSHPDIERCLRLATISFGVSALLFLVGKREHLLRIPKWVLVGVLGSLISFVTIVWFHDDLSVQNPGFLDYLQAGLRGNGAFYLVMFTIFDTLLALPVMALFHYLPKLTRFVLRRS